MKIVDSLKSIQTGVNYISLARNRRQSPVEMTYFVFWAAVPIGDEVL